jgi:succinate dehydrogenase / fumarate reductase cytochrome b subunit
MSRFLRILKTSIGRKLLMAVSGLFMLGFVVGHLLGNLKMFAGPEEMNSYAEFLHQHPSLTWPVRLGLIAALVSHVVTGALLWGKNRAARPRGYARNRTRRASLASRLMLFSGLGLLGFIVYHLLHFTFLVVPGHGEHSLAYDSAGRHDVYSMVLAAFTSPALVVGYVLAMGALGLHLWHGAQSFLQTFGIHHSTYNGLLRGAAKTLIVLLVLGFCAVPLSIFCGLLPSAG